VFVVGRLLERGTGDGAAAAEVLALREGLQRHLEASGKTRKGVAADAEGGTRGGCWWDGGQVSQTLNAMLSKRQTMPEKNRFPAVLQPTVWPAECAGTLGQSASGSGSPGYSNQEIFSQHGANLVPQPVPFTKSKRAQSNTDDETWVDGKVNPTLSLFDSGDTRATTVAVSFTVDMQACKGNANVGDGSVSPTLCKPSGNDVHAVAFTPGNLARGAGASPNAEVSQTLQSQQGRGATDQHPCVAFHPLQDPISSTDGSTHCMGTGSSRGDATIAVAVAPSLTATNDPSRSPQSSEVTQQVAAVHASTMTVRRLSARECERLQGFPDDWTLIPWRKKPAEECPDGPRYKALGNSMACNCMAWIGERIAAYEQRGRVDPTPAGTAGIAPAGDLNHEGDRHG
jgi:hypothetical protein